MYIFRFMSEKEFNNYINGKNLLNKKVHKKMTNSIGFCFGSGNSNIDIATGDAKFAWKYLEGALDEEPDICAIFWVDDELLKDKHPKNVKDNDPYIVKGFGRYADPYGDFFSSIYKDEYSCKWYSKKYFKLVKYCNNFREEDWIWNQRIF